MRNLFRILTANALILMSIVACDPSGSEPEEIPVTAIVLSSRSLLLEFGSTNTLTATVHPGNANQTVTWSSDTPAVATVDATGLVSAMSEGTAVVSATTVSGGRIATCTVTVGPEPNPDNILTMIPDPAFRRLCVEAMTRGMLIEKNLYTGEETWSDPWDSDDDGKLSPGEAAEVTEINVDGDIIWNVDQTYTVLGEIVSMQGLKHFPNLQHLSCIHNLIYSLDVTQNPKLSRLICYYNRLTQLDVTQNPELVTLSCASNQLSSLDVTHNPELNDINCDHNDIGHIDLSANPLLTSIVCSANNLTQLDVSKNPLLTGLYCSTNDLTELDISDNPLLTGLDCSTNDLSELDLSYNPLLISIYCHTNKLTEIDVSKNPLLTELSCDSNKLTEIDVSSNTELTSLYCGSNLLISLDISKCRLLIRFSCYRNPGENGVFRVKTWFDSSYLHPYPQMFQTSGWDGVELLYYN